MFTSEFLRCLIELSKPNITKLVLVTSGMGYCLASNGLGDLSTLFFTLLGTTLTCGGSGALNNYIERDYDCLMKRTACRPLPSGRIKPAQALGFGLLLVLSGTVILVAMVNLLSGFLALLTAFLYVLVYTPLKRLTWLNTFIGAIPGALPPLGGWAAATGELGAGGWILFTILFIWQMPHFYSIAWMYRNDYAQAGYKMITLNDDDGQKTFSQIIFFSLVLLVVSFLPVYLQNIGYIYVISAALLGVYVLAYGVASFFARSHKSARALLRSTVIYLPLLLTSLLIDSFI